MPEKSSLFKSLLPSSLGSSLRRSRVKSEDDDGQPSNASGLSAYSRRRQQVRRAQMNHRERNQNYTKALEEEIARLRELKQMNQELRETETENRALRGLVTSNNLALPDGIGERRQPTTKSAELSFAGPPGPKQSIHTEGFVSAETSTDERQGQSSNLEPGSPANTGTTPSSINPVKEEDITAEKPNITPIRPHNHNPNLDAELAGFDFVLMLEQPCLVHAHSEMLPGGATGHALTLSAATLAYAPSPSAQSHTKWQVPTAELERLLEMSDNLDLQSSEITPIQAWDRIRKHPKFSSLTRDQLQGLAQKLLREVVCHGFGGVIQESKFVAILAEYLPS